MTLAIKKTVFVLMATLFCSTMVAAQAASDLVGKWKAEEDASKQFDIYLAEDGLYYGKTSNGKIALKKLQFNAKNKSYKGTMNPPDIDVSLDVTITFETSSRLKLVAKKFLMSKTIYLIKVTN